jgi:hypothetical protein
MATYKRKAKTTCRGATKRRTYVKSNKRKTSVRRLVQSVVDRNIETKTSVYSTTDGAEILHNNFILLSNNILQTSQGYGDPDGIGGTNAGNRIGDKVTIKGIAIKMMLELNERYSDVTIRIVIVKSARGDIPTRDTMFNGLSANKMLDTFNKERYTIISSKFVKLKAPNQAIQENTSGTNLAGQGYDSHASGSLSRATKIVSMWIPGHKFGCKGVIQYDH